MGEWEGGLYRKKFAETGPDRAADAGRTALGCDPRGRTGARLHRRVRAVITQIAAAHVGERIAVFTHAGVIGEALAQASGAEPFAFIGPNNASISQMFVTADKWVVRRFNDASHLEPG